MSKREVDEAIEIVEEIEGMLFDLSLVADLGNDPSIVSQTADVHDKVRAMHHELRRHRDTLTPG